MTSQSPRVGVGVVVVREGLVLLGLRQGAHGAGTWGLPGGHLEFGESIEQCARREVLEETGLEIQEVSRGTYSNDVFDGKHYVTLFVAARCKSGEPRVLEPDKCVRWGWFRWSDLPSPLFQPLASVRDAGYRPVAT
ncbi:NUDIX domain-containing protein [Ideonella sp. DXS29W]|uniref:NUDIX domain-containing protein n=1 Tax=Ideonella lacteola TaxID=2984193 RepID=A0ABU9BVK9_9BURK